MGKSLQILQYCQFVDQIQLHFNILLNGWMFVNPCSSFSLKSVLYVVCIHIITYSRKLLDFTEAYFAQHFMKSRESEEVYNFVENSIELKNYVLFIQGQHI